uniref:CARD domain-containing protein n=1 Tax=Plectus sambesii TaxID=2011161 RepID=A0A914XAN5_9BILA
MDELKEAAIKDHYANIVKCINSLWVMDHLVTLLSLDEMDFIRKSQFTPQERTRELIAILFKKSEELRPFERFIKALEKTDTSHEIMAKAILNTYVCLLIARLKC